MFRFREKFHREKFISYKLWHSIVAQFPNNTSNDKTGRETKIYQRDWMTARCRNIEELGIERARSSTALRERESAIVGQRCIAESGPKLIFTVGFN